MTGNQLKFADEYLLDLNGTRAYKAAYKNVTKDTTAAVNASRLLRNAKVKKYIDDRLELLKKKKIAEQDEVLQYLTSLMRGEEIEETLMGTGGGEQTIKDIKVSAKERLKAAELLGRRYATFTDNTDVNIKTPIIMFDMDSDDNGKN